MPATCLTCGVPFVLIRTDPERQIATFQCPVCGYVVDVHLTSDLIEPARKPPPDRR
jgi:hypothetical protein